jgi:predicted ATPase
LSSFVGRERELAEVLARLERGARLFTLTGPGGSGKTRLALEAATSLVPEYKAGVFWIGLASLRDASLVPEQIAQTLGTTDALADYIGEREMLLLLDNLEQVVEAAPELAELLSACPNLTLLCTSRELLRVHGEVEFAVPALASRDSVELFCARSGLEATDEIAGLCARLDNLPLAVELAAARAKALTPTQIVERLTRRLDFLRGGRDADPRQQTLRATIEWSYQLLSAEEQRLFGVLSVFSGGCTLAAAEEVADADVDTLQSLVEKSLVRFANGRYSMLEAIREYASERLEQAGETDRPRRRHCHYFRHLAAEAEPALFGRRDQAEQLRRLDAERFNISRALDWAVRGDPELGIELAGAVWRLWWYRGYLLEGFELLRRTLEAAATADPLLRLQALEGASYLAYRRGDVDAMRPFCDEGLALARQLDDEASSGIFVNQLALAATADGDHERSDELLEESARLLARHPYRRYVLGNVGSNALRRGDTARAISVLTTVLDLDRASEDEHHFAGVAAWLAVASSQHGDARAANDYARQSLTAAAELGAEEATAIVLIVAASVLRDRDPVVAARTLGRVDAILEGVGAGRGFIVPGLDEQRLRSELEDVLGQDFAAAYAGGGTLSSPAVVEEALASLVR